MPKKFRPPGDLAFFAPPKPRKKPSVSDDANTIAVQALVVFRALSRKWQSIAEIAALIERDPKTARRLVAAVKKAGFRVRVKVEDHGRKKYRVR